MEAPQLSPHTIAEKINDLPTLSPIVQELTQMIANPLVSANAIEKLIAQDQSLTTRILQLANSAFYAVPGGAATLARAIQFLGFNTVHQLVVATSVFRTLRTAADSSFDLKEFWLHAVGVAVAAETIGKNLRMSSTHELFTAGLIHDMGKVALYAIDSAWTEAIVRKARSESITYLQAELALNLPTHAQLGFHLAEKWGLPKSVQALIRHHHPQEKRGPLEAELARSVDIVALANIFIHVLRFGDSGHQGVTGVPRELLIRLGLTQDLKALLTQIRGGLVKVSGFVAVLEGGKP